MVGLEYFTNDRYEILKVLYNNQVKIKEDYYIPLSQQEIADIAHLSKVKVNQTIKKLKELGFVATYKNTRGKYTLTEKAVKVFKIIEDTKL